jgi:glycosyltransferase involved in cell wall biosynthesis
MPSLRILQILPSLAPETGGPTTSLPGIGRSLAKLGHEVVLYTTEWPACAISPKSPIVTEKASGYQIVSFPAQKSPFFPNLPYSPALVRAVAANCRKFDIVHNFSLWNPIATFSLRALRKSNSLYCVSPLGMLDPIVLRRNPWKKLPWRFFLERANIEGSALIHFTTELEEERARSCWKLNRSVVIPHAVNLERWESLPDRSAIESRFPQIRGREVILFVGRINWVKNLDVLLKALVKVIAKRPRAMLLCVGPDNDAYRPTLEKQARELGIHDRLVFTGMLQGDDLKAAYACGDTLALVSQKENFGHSAAEALACGIPVVLSNGVGVGANWPASNAVFRVEPDPDPIASALIRSLERKATVGFPDPEARSLARRFFHNFEGGFLVAAFHAILSQRHHLL